MRPNDERHFIHGKLLGLAGGVAQAAGNIGSFLPGSQFLRTGGAALSALGANIRQSGMRSNIVPSIIPVSSLPRSIIAPRQTGTAPRIPESDPMNRNRSVGIAPQDRFQNGCPTEPTVCAPRGFHLNKSSYFLSDGTFIAKGSRFVRNRRLNDANGRAQDKAIVRLEKGQDHAKKLLKATGWRTISKQSSKEIRIAKKAVCK